MSSATKKPLWYAPFLIALLAPLPGAFGIALRTLIYPKLFGSVGRGVIFAANLSVWAPENITIADGAILDDHLTLDARDGHINLGAQCYLGRGSHLRCGNGGSITLHEYANLSTFITLDANGGPLVVGAKTLMGPHDRVRGERKGIQIGSACWLGAHVQVADGVSIGEQAVLGAATSVVENIAHNVIAVGSPARIVRKRGNAS